MLCLDSTDGTMIQKGVSAMCSIGMAGGKGWRSVLPAELRYLEMFVSIEPEP